MDIFISYSSKYRDLCERIRLALEAEGHDVFVDRRQLEPGHVFDEPLREAVAGCDLFVFLLSPETVEPGSYALTELGFAQRRWRHPAGRVLPVMVAPVLEDAIPPYLRAVTILQPRGDAAAETAAAVAQIPRSARRRLAVAGGVVLLLGAGAIGGYLYWQGQRAEQAHASQLLAAARSRCDAADHALAWQRFEEALARHPSNAQLRTAREDCGMRWLREIRVRQGGETFTDIVKRVLPALEQAAASARGRRAADLHAHMGWADFLRTRDGAAGLDPSVQYRKALAEEPANVYGHAMWAHFIMTRRGSSTEALEHFNAALAAERERAYVRSLQFSGMLYYPWSNAEGAVLQVANDMRKAGEAVEAGHRALLWSRVYERLLRANERAPVLAALPGREGLQTFLSLYPEEELPADRRNRWQLYVGVLEEAAGEREAARARLVALRDELQRQRVTGSLLDETMTALKQLGGA